MSGVNFGQFASDANRRAVPPSAVGADFDVQRFEITQAGTPSELVIPGNSNRFALFFQTWEPSGQVFWSFHHFTASENAYDVNLMTSHTLTYRDLPSLITYPIYGFVSFGVSTYEIYEISYRPQR